MKLVVGLMLLVGGLALKATTSGTALSFLAGAATGLGLVLLIKGLILMVRDRDVY